MPKTRPYPNETTDAFRQRVASGSSRPGKKLPRRRNPFRGTIAVTAPKVKGK